MQIDRDGPATSSAQRMARIRPHPTIALMLASSLVAVRPLSAAAKSRCPSAFGPGKHVVRLSLPGEGVTWERSFDLFVPETMPLGRRQPALFMWHGCGSDPEKFQEESEMHLRAAQRREQYYVLYPRGTSSALSPDLQHTCQSADGVRCGWNSGFPAPGGCDVPTNPYPDDVGFASALLRWVEVNLCVDPGRVFIAGFSNGGSMTYKLACEIPTPFAGMMTIGAAAGASVTPGTPTGCAPAKKLPSINVCGSLDSCYGGGGATLRSQLATFAAFNNCSNAADGDVTIVERRLSETSYCLVADACPVSLQTKACGVTGLGHCWPNVPGAGDLPCRNQNPENFDASEYTLLFFDSVKPATGRRLSSWAIVAVTVVAVVPSVILGGFVASRWMGTGSRNTVATGHVDNLPAAAMETSSSQSGGSALAQSLVTSQSGGTNLFADYPSRRGSVNDFGIRATAI